MIVLKKSDKNDSKYNLSIVVCACLQEYKVELEGGDVIIAATDGLFDNLYDQEISSMVLASLDNDQPLEVLKQDV